MAKSYQDRVPTKGLLSQNFEIRSPFQKAFYMVPKLSQREASIIEPVTQTTTVGTVTIITSRKQSRKHPHHRKGVAGGMGGVGWKANLIFCLAGPPPSRSQNEPTGGQHQVHCNDEV